MKTSWKAMNCIQFGLEIMLLEVHTDINSLKEMEIWKSIMWHTMNLMLYRDMLEIIMFESADCKILIH